MLGKDGSTIIEGGTRIGFGRGCAPHALQPLINLETGFWKKKASLWMRQKIDLGISCSNQDSSLWIHFLGGGRGTNPLARKIPDCLNTWVPPPPHELQRGSSLLAIFMTSWSKKHRFSSFAIYKIMYHVSKHAWNSAWRLSFWIE